MRLVVHQSLRLALALPLAVLPVAPATLGRTPLPPSPVVASDPTLEPLPAEASPGAVVEVVGDGPELTVLPSNGQRGTIVELGGWWVDRAAGKDVAVSVVWQPGDEEVGEAAISPDGTIAGEAVIPLDAALGAGALAICIDDVVGNDDVGGERECAPTEFEVLEPALVANPTDLDPGDAVNVTGTGWCCAGADVTVVDADTGTRWGVGTVDDTGMLTAGATVPSDAVDGTVVLTVCARGYCRQAQVSVVVVPPITNTTSTTASTTASTTTSTTTATTTVPPAESTTTTTTVVHDPDDDHRLPVAAAAIGGTAGLVVGSLLWRRLRRGRRDPRLRGRVVPRPDAGRQSTHVHGRPAIAVSAVLDIGRGKSTMHIRRTS